MEHNEPIRKACDLCYRKRIKCDGQEPRCSHCVIYNSDCTRKSAPRRSTLKKRVIGSREAELESRVKKLESQLSTVLEELEGRHKADPRQTAPGMSSSIRTGTAQETLTRNTSTHNSAHNIMPLESLHEILPVIEWYLETSNSLLPLFDPSEVLSATKDWYYKPHTREPAIWAMINVILALSHHNGYSGKKPHSINDTTYISNAQSVLTDAIAHQTSLMHVQVIIGLSMLFRTANEPTPAVVLIATAIRLAHKLGLHRRGSEQHDPALRLQRDRVFWVAYILDRSISAQTRLSPVQLDNDIDLDLPSLEPPHNDLAGFVITDNGHTKFNFFRASVEMARIQGLVYQYVYSASAQLQSPTEQAQNVALIHGELDAWTTQVPVQLHPTALSGHPELSRSFCLLYCTRLSCRAMISYGSALDSFHYSKWVGRLQDYGEKVAAGQVVSPGADQQGWLTLVEESRDYLKMFLTVKQRDTIFTMTTLCAYITSLISLVANNMFDANSSVRASDDVLIEAALSPLGEVVKQTGSLQETYEALQALRSYARFITGQNELEVSNFLGEPAWTAAAELPNSEILHFLFPTPDEGHLWDLGSI